MATRGLEPVLMGLGPVAATERVRSRCGSSPVDMDALVLEVI